MWCPRRRRAAEPCRSGTPVQQGQLGNGSRPVSLSRPATDQPRQYEQAQADYDAQGQGGKPWRHLYGRHRSPISLAVSQTQQILVGVDEDQVVEMPSAARQYPQHLVHVVHRAAGFDDDSDLAVGIHFQDAADWSVIGRPLDGWPNG